MTDKTYKTDQKRHGGYRNLRSYQTTTLIYDLTVEFCKIYLTDKTDKTYKTYKTYLRSAEEAANVAICLIHQANYLLDRQLESLKKAFIEKGGFTENLFKARLQRRESDR